MENKTKSKSLKVLPSMVILPEGTVVKLEQLEENEKRTIGNNIGEKMSAYYALHPKQWNVFTNDVS